MQKLRVREIVNKGDPRVRLEDRLRNHVYADDIIEIRDKLNEIIEWINKYESNRKQANK